MNREIEFRAKKKDNGEWVYGSLIRSDEFYGEIRETPKYYICPFETTFEYDECSDDSDEVITETIGQYVGLKDKNGTKIFEGDIVKIEIYSYSRKCFNAPIIKALEETFYVPVKYKTKRFKDGDEHEFVYDGFCAGNWSIREAVEDNCVVIGNIYDNHELLQQAE